jgi:signal transduction histidine kinase
MPTDTLAGGQGRWRSTTGRLIATYGLLFVAWSSLLVGVIYWQSRSYLDNVSDEVLSQRVAYMSAVPPDELPALLDTANRLDRPGLSAYGLFTPNGVRLRGNLRGVPAGVLPDRRVRFLPHGAPRLDRDIEEPSRAIATRLADGRQLVLVRRSTVATRLADLIRNTTLATLSLVLLPGLVGGLLLSRGPKKRLRAIEAATQPIVRGDLRQRLPVSRRGDELDMLAAIVNRMLDELERLMREVRGVADNIAHDLRTPLTRLRTQLHRLAQPQGDEDERRELSERCIGEVDGLLERFRALLRIAELEDQRRRAGFEAVDLGGVLRRVHELYLPLAEDAGLHFMLEAPALPPVQADPGLLFEALSNLVSNAIKFTPAGGTVQLLARRLAEGPQVELSDSGPGIPAAERQAVLQRFYRSPSTSRGTPGSGLGLSIVVAIARLHGFALALGEAPSGGARVRLDCW